MYARILHRHTCSLSFICIHTYPSHSFSLLEIHLQYTCVCIWFEPRTRLSNSFHIIFVVDLPYSYITFLPVSFFLHNIVENGENKFKVAKRNIIKTEKDNTHNISKVCKENKTKNQIASVILLTDCFQLDWNESNTQNACLYFKSNYSRSLNAMCVRPTINVVVNVCVHVILKANESFSSVLLSKEMNVKQIKPNVNTVSTN